MSSVVHFVSRMEENDCYLYNLKPPIFSELRNILDEDRLWLELLKVFPDFTASDVSRLQNHNILQSPAEKLLNLFCHEGMTIKSLATVLYHLKLERPLRLLCDYEPPEVKVQPPRIITLGSSDISLKIEFQAEGFPFPKYEWFKHTSYSSVELIAENENEPVLEIAPVSKSLEGIYYCRFYNVNEKEEIIQTATNDVRVVVLGHSWNENSDNKLQIIKQPKAPADKISSGSSISLEVEAKGSLPLKYQWYKNKKSIPNENSEELRLKNIVPENGETSWTYYCCVSNSVESILTDDVIITVESKQQEAEDKIAILIGNECYFNKDKLFRAKDDVLTLSKIFQAMNFKVFQFFDLTCRQMKGVIDYVCKEFIDKGVYVVFYFAGHGFQLNHQCYMLPVDSPKDKYRSSDVVCAHETLKKIQLRNPGIIVMILDMCRKIPDAAELDETFDMEPHRNTLIAYATSPSSSAYEIKSEKNGFFVSHLIKFLQKDETIDAIFSSVKQSFDQYSHADQHPWIEGNLPGKSKFLDPIRETPTTIARNKKFEELNAPPELIHFNVRLIQISLRNLTVRVKFLTFPNLLRNVPSIETENVVEVSHPDDNVCYTAFIHVSLLKHNTQELTTHNKILEFCPEFSLTKTYFDIRNWETTELHVSLQITENSKTGDQKLVCDKPLEINFPNLFTFLTHSFKLPIENTV